MHTTVFSQTTFSSMRPTFQNALTVALSGE